MNINFSSEQLHRAADLKERIEALQAELSALLGSPESVTPRYISFEARARMAAAARARGAGLRGNKQGQPAHTPRRRISAKARARLSAIARARWRKVKAAGKNAL
jgi:hypothetical protein